MRKTQETLIEKAKKAEYFKEQIATLEREDLTIKELTGVFHVFELIRDFPPEEAVKYIKSGKNAYDLGIPGYQLTYAEYMQLPELLRNGVYSLRFACRVRKLLREKEQGDSLLDFLESFGEEVEGEHYLNFYYMGEYSRKQLDKGNIPAADMYYMLHGMKRITDVFVKHTEELICHLSSNKKNVGSSFERDFQKKQIERIRSKDPNKIEDCLWHTDIATFFFWKQCKRAGLTPLEAAETAVQRFLGNTNTKFLSSCDIYALTDDLPRTMDSYQFRTPEEEKAVKYLLECTTLVTSVKYTKAFRVILSKRESNQGTERPLFVRFLTSSDLRIVVNKVGRRVFELGNIICDDEYIIYGNGCIYRHARNRYIPATIRNIVQSFKRSGGELLLSRIMEIKEIKESYVIKDLLVECDEMMAHGMTFPPLRWNDCIGFKNKNHLMKSLYKGGQDIDWNRWGVSRGYCYMKTKPYVDEKSLGILYNAFANKAIIGVRNEVTRLHQKLVACDVATQFLSQRLTRLHPDVENQIEIEARDYVRNTLAAKAKLNLRWNSLRKLTERNIDVENRHRNRLTEKIMIPKDSKFNGLRKVLGDDFEWIKTKKRIIQEGQDMKHCVASYAGLVNCDECAIYHLTYKDIGYTIEFRMFGKQYKAFQIQSKADRGAPPEVWDYVENILAS